MLAIFVSKANFVIGNERKGIGYGQRHAAVFQALQPGQTLVGEERPHAQFLETNHTFRKNHAILGRALNNTEASRFNLHDSSLRKARPTRPKPSSIATNPLILATRTSHRHSRPPRINEKSANFQLFG